MVYSTKMHTNKTTILPSLSATVNLGTVLPVVQHSPCTFVFHMPVTLTVLEMMRSVDHKEGLVF